MYTTNYCNKKQNALEKINKTKSWFFEKFAKIDKSLVMLSKKKRVRSPKLSIPQVEYKSLLSSTWTSKEGRGRLMS